MAVRKRQVGAMEVVMVLLRAGKREMWKEGDTCDQDCVNVGVVCGLSFCISVTLYQTLQCMTDQKAQIVHLLQQYIWLQNKRHNNVTEPSIRV
jgi:hypothetical protein